MDDVQDLLDVVGLIYEASYRPAEWSTVLRRVAEATGSSSAALVYRDEAYPRANFVYAHGIPTETFQAYMERYIHLDPFVDLIAKNLPLGQVSAEHLLVSSREELRNIAPEFYDEFMIPHDLYHIGGSGLLLDGERMAAIAIQRNRALGPWREEQLARLACLTEHFQRAFRIHREFTRLRVQEYALYAMLDQLVIGLVLVDRNEHVIYSNPVARLALKSHPAVNMRGKRITATDVESARALSNHISRAVNRAHDTVSERGGIIGLRHADSDYPLVMLITPVTDLKQAFRLDDESAAVAIFISDPQHMQAIDPDALQEIYNLSRAEAEVAVALANGMNMKDISAAKEVSLETVRSQLKSVYRKTGTNGQSDLIRLLLKGVFSIVH